MRSARDFFKPLAIGAPEPPREIPFRPSRMIHFFDPSNPKMAAKRDPDLIGRRHGLGNVVECRMKGVSAVSCHLPEEVFLRGDVVVERRLLHPELLGEVGERGALIAPFGEQPGSDPGQLLPPRAHLCFAA